MAASSSRITLDLLKGAARSPAVQKRARATVTSTPSTPSRRIPSSQHVISRRCLHSTSPVSDDAGRGRKEEPRFNFNTSLYFTEDPDPDVSSTTQPLALMAVFKPARQDPSGCSTCARQLMTACQLSPSHSDRASVQEGTANESEDARQGLYRRQPVQRAFQA